MKGLTKTSITPVERRLGQFMTPAWAADLLVARFFGDLSSTDFVVEPSCGVGRFLSAIPGEVPAIGVEIDPRLAHIAHRNTGREILIGDFCSVEIDTRPTAIIGNVPFELAVVDRFLNRAYDLIVQDGRVGWILPAFALQTAKRVVRYNERWSIEQTMLPRNLFHGLEHPLTFAIFRKDEQRTLSGFFLYHQTVDVKALPTAYREIFEKADGAIWQQAAARALRDLGAPGTVEQVCQRVEGNRPTSTQFWREAIRKNLRQHFPRVERGVYTLPTAA
jgi:site-specific DNA-methyltransferase (adenine-specific)